jgi:hypothetical protein
MPAPQATAFERGGPVTSPNGIHMSCITCDGDVTDLCNRSARGGRAGAWLAVQCVLAAQLLVAPRLALPLCAKGGTAVLLVAVVALQPQSRCKGGRGADSKVGCGLLLGCRSYSLLVQVS